MESKGCPCIKGMEDLHMPPVLYWDATTAMTSKEKCRGLPLSQCEPEQRPAPHESLCSVGSSRTAFLEPPNPCLCPCPHPAPSHHPSAPSPSQGCVAPAEQKPPGNGHTSPDQPGCECGCSLSKAARKRKT